MKVKYIDQNRGLTHVIGKTVDDPLNEKNMTAAEKQRALAAAKVKGQIAAAKASQRLKNKL